MSEIDQKLRADLADWYEMSRGGTMQPDAKEHLDYLMIEHGIPRRSLDEGVGVSGEVLPPPPPPITFKPDIVERPGAPYGKREW